LFDIREPHRKGATPAESLRGPLQSPSGQETAIAGESEVCAMEDWSA